MKAFVLVAALAACAPEQIQAPPVPAPIEIAARPRPAPRAPTYDGVVMSRTSHPLTVSDESVIGELRVAAGDAVEAGQVLAILEDPALRAELARVPKKSKARASIEKRLAGMKLVAPAAGVVSSIQIAKGATAKRGAEVMRIASTKKLQLRFALPVEQAGSIAKGARVTATIAGRGTPIEAIVRSIGPVTEAPIRLSIVDADLTVRDLTGLHGALATVTLN